MSINNSKNIPYNQTYKMLFSCVYILQSFINNKYIKNILKNILGNIKILNLKLYSENIIFKDDIELRDNLIWRVEYIKENKKNEIILLFEFQNEKDKLMPLKISKYVSLISKKIILSEKNIDYNNLPYIIPFVIYNGNSKWDIVTDVSDMFNYPTEESKKIGLWQQYQLIDIKNDKINISEENTPIDCLFIGERVKNIHDFIYLLNSIDSINENIYPATKYLLFFMAKVSVWEKYSSEWGKDQTAIKEYRMAAERMSDEMFLKMYIDTIGEDNYKNSEMIYELGRELFNANGKIIELENDNNELKNNILEINIKNKQYILIDMMRDRFAFDKDIKQYIFNINDVDKLQNLIDNFNIYNKETIFSAIKN